MKNYILFLLFVFIAPSIFAQQSTTQGIVERTISTNPTNTVPLKSGKIGQETIYYEIKGVTVVCAKTVEENPSKPEDSFPPNCLMHVAKNSIVHLKNLDGWRLTAVKSLFSKAATKGEPIYSWMVVGGDVLKF